MEDRTPPDNAGPPAAGARLSGQAFRKKPGLLALSLPDGSRLRSQPLMERAQKPAC